LGRWLLPLILVAALLLRLCLLLTVLDPIQSDEAVIGLMAQHIRGGARPLFDYDLLYHGPLEAYLAAPLFGLFGMNRFVMRLAPLAFSLLFVYAVYLLANRLYGRQVALASALYAAIPAPMLTIWGLRFGAGYIVVLTLSTLALRLALDLHRGAILPLVLLLLVGFWTHYVTGYTIAAIILVTGLAAFRRRVPRLPGKAVAPVALAAVALLVGLLTQLDASTASGSLSTAAGLLTMTFPVLLGFFQPSTSAELFARQTAESGAGNAIAIILGALAAAVVGRAAIRRIRQGDTLLPLFVFLTLIIFSIFVTLLHSPSALLQEPRYLLPLYGAIPLAAWALFDLVQRPARLRAIALGGVVLLNLYGNLSMQPALNQPYVSGHTLADNRALIDWLDAKGIRHVYADYWIGYWLAFDSGERIVPFIIAGDRAGWNRYPPYAAQVEQSTNPAYIFVADSAETRSFETGLRAQQIRYDAASIDVFRVYWSLSSPIRYSVVATLVADD
jgi:4-amino-4-deoxy-L-arabinose transferase-like glycosyltransferase